MIPIDMWDFRLFVRECVKTGKTDEIIKILTEENVIPQGEWILQYRTCGDEFYTCSLCERAIEVDYPQTLKDFPYCHCGAKMRGGAE